MGTNSSIQKVKMNQKNTRTEKTFKIHLKMNKYGFHKMV